MKTRALILIACLTMGLCLFALCGCGDENSDITDEPDLDADYLMGEYTDQLITDGAEQVLGSVVVIESDGTYEAVLEEKKVVASDRYDNGYYIADRNLQHKYSFDADSRVVLKKHGDMVYVDAMSYAAQQADEDTLFNVYVIGDSVELMVAVDPSEVLNK